MQTFGKIALWISIATWALWLGGLMYETAVIVPIWSASLPESVLKWSTSSQPVDPRDFFAPVAFGTVLFSAIAFALGWRTNRRSWLALSAVCAVVALGATFAYFVPRNNILFSNQASGLSGEDIAAAGQGWIVGNWFRLGIMAAGFCAALHALGLSYHGNLTVNENKT